MFFPSKKEATSTRQLGKIGEDAGTRFLLRQGYQILVTNYRSCFGEIDIIARDRQGNIVFVEVKSRRNYNFGHPVEAVDSRKQRHIVRSALYFLKEKRLFGCGIRFLVLGVEKGKIDMYEDEFWGRDRYTV